MCLVAYVYCFMCGKRFKKTNTRGDWEPCPHCGAEITDLSEESQFAVKMIVKGFEESEVYRKGIFA